MAGNLLKVHGSGNTFYLYETTDETAMDWFKFGEWLCRKIMMVVQMAYC